MMWTTSSFKREQGPRVSDTVAQQVGGDVVAADFALVADGAGEPPDGRMIEKQGFGRDLEAVDQEVVTGDVGEFVSEDRLQMFRCQVEDR